jgi:hypothetical protein
MKQKTCDIGGAQHPGRHGGPQRKAGRVDAAVVLRRRGGVTRGYAFWSVLAGPFH